MTTGHILSDLTTTIPSGKVGLYFERQWSGGDRSHGSSRPVKPVSPGSFHDFVVSSGIQNLRKGDRVAHMDNLLSRWRSMRDSYNLQLHAYHKQKAEWRKSLKTELHSYSLRLMSQRHGTCSYRNIPGNWGSEFSSSSGAFGSVNPSVTWNNNDEISLINKVQGQLDGGVGFHLGVSLAEADQTFRMIRDNARRFRRIGESLVAGDINKAFRVALNGSSAHHIRGLRGLKTASDNYLLFMFGVIPLVDSVIDAARHYGYKAARARVIRVSAKREIEASVAGPSHGFWTQRGSTTIKGQVIAYIDTNELTDEEGAFDLPSILWERLPYSFVVDWWFNVGNYLTALHTSRLTSGSRFCRTQTTRVKIGDYGTGSIYSISPISPSSLSVVQVERNISSVLAVPPPRMKPLLHPKSEVMLTHALEAVALITKKSHIFKPAFEKLGL